MKTVKQTIPSYTSFKTFEDCCAYIGDDPADKKFSEGPEDEVALRRCKVIALAFNGGRVLSFKNRDEEKWMLVIYWDGSGFRFDGAYYDCTYSGAGAGSRLAFLDKARVLHAAEHFLQEYIPMM